MEATDIVFFDEQDLATCLVISKHRMQGSFQSFIRTFTPVKTDIGNVKRAAIVMGADSRSSVPVYLA